MRWLPMGARRVFNVEGLTPGDLLAIDHQVLRVVEVSRRPADLVTEGREFAIVTEPVSGGKRQHYAARRTAEIYRYPDEHYPVCAKCHEPLPCREQVIDRQVKEETKREARYSTPGVCPACQEPISSRQARQVWPENLVAFTGQPVAFHLRRKCETGALEYDRLWMKQGHVSQLGQVSS